MAIKPLPPDDLPLLPDEIIDSDQFAILRNSKLFRAPLTSLPAPEQTSEATFLQIFDLPPAFPHRFYQPGYVVRLFQNGTIGIDFASAFSTGVPIGIDAGQIEGTNLRRVVHRGLVRMTFNQVQRRITEGFFPRPVYHTVTTQYPFIVPRIGSDHQDERNDSTRLGAFNPGWFVGYVVGRIAAGSRQVVCYVDFGLYNVFNFEGNAVFDDDLEAEIRTFLPIDNLDFSFINA